MAISFRQDLSAMNVSCFLNDATSFSIKILLYLIYTAKIAIFQILKTTLLGNFPFPALLFTLLCNLIVLFRRKKSPPDSARDEPFGGISCKGTNNISNWKTVVCEFSEYPY